MKSLLSSNSVYCKRDYIKRLLPLVFFPLLIGVAEFSDYTTSGGIAFLFVCVAYKGHWGEMEPIYLMRLAKNLRVPFVGFHAFGEIGPLDPQGFSLMQNQTLTLAVLSEK